jgi:hypothetical protein
MSESNQVEEPEDRMIPLFPGVDIKKSLAAAREHKAKLAKLKEAEEVSDANHVF